MADCYLGEIRVFSFGFAPKNWAPCAGQSLSIQQNTPLFSLLGTTYGGDGIRTFQLPDLRGRAPLNQGNGQFGNVPLGTLSGLEAVQLSLSQVPSHSHTLQASSTTAATNLPGSANALAAGTAAAPIYAAPTSLAAMNANALASTGGAPHNNMQPSLVLNFCIALYGIFPSRN